MEAPAVRAVINRYLGGLVSCASATSATSAGPDAGALDGGRFRTRWGLRFRVLEIWFGVQGSRLGVHGVGCGVQGLLFLIQGCGV